MYVEKKTIRNREYYYLRISVRQGKRVKTKTLKYLGVTKPTKAAVERAKRAFTKKSIEAIKEQLRAELRASSSTEHHDFLTDTQFKKLEHLQKDFANKRKVLQKHLYRDMLQDFTVYYIYNTNAIEGNTITLEETSLLLNDHITPGKRDLREVYDHVNGKETFEYILEKLPEVSHSTIIDIHTQLLKNIDKRVGAYRRHNVRIFGADVKTSPAEYVKADMDLLLKWYKKNEKIVHPLVLAAVFHEKFERIHPFYDGNGRTGRMLLNLMLLKKNFPPMIVAHRERKQYYAALSAGHKGKLTELEPQFYGEIIQFCFSQLIRTYEEIFAQWG